MPALGSAVKTHRRPRRAIVFLTAGIRSQSRHTVPGHVAHNRRTPYGVVRRAVWSSFRDHSCLVRNPAEIEAVVMFSHAKRGNHPALWASCCHGFIRFSGGAYPIRGDFGSCACDRAMMFVHPSFGCSPPNPTRLGYLWQTIRGVSAELTITCTETSYDDFAYFAGS